MNTIPYKIMLKYYTPNGNLVTRDAVVLAPSPEIGLVTILDCSNVDSFHSVSITRVHFTDSDSSVITLSLR
jgi:hypothetical protein